jgi:hypothetical protein
MAKMSQISAVKDAVQTVVKKDRLLNAVFAGGKSFVTSLGRTFYAFYLQTTGLIFLMFTGYGAWDLYHHYQLDHFADRMRLWIVAPVSLILAFFTVHSFIKASRTLKRK